MNRNFLHSAIIVVSIIFLIVVSLSLFSNQDSQPQPELVSYSVLMDQVTSNKVQAVVINYDQQLVLWTNSQGQQFRTLLANDSSFISELRSKKVLIDVVKKEENLLSSALISVVSTIINVLFWVLVFRFVLGYAGGSGIMGIKNSPVKPFNRSDSNITFDDVQGIDECKDEVKEIVEFLKDPKKFLNLGGKIPKGCLLVGPPGTGKTLLSRAIAGEAKVPFFYTSGSSFIEMFVGVGASRVRSMFEEAKKAAPCIIFIDEIDAIGKMRNVGSYSANDEREQTLNQLLVEMDGFSGHEGIIIIAATNRPEVLDKALMRPGRFDRQIYVPVPDINGRRAILDAHIKKIVSASDVEVDVLAKGTPGFTGADLANLVNEAALLAGKNNHTLVTMSDFEKAKDRLFLGRERKSMMMTDDDKKLVAYHEGGHALVSYYIPGADPIHKVTIIPHGRALGVVLSLPEQDDILLNITQLKAKITIAMGGRIAEELVLGKEKITTGASSDIVVATQIARKMVMEWGMSEKVGVVNYSDENQGISLINFKTTQVADNIEVEIKKIIDDCKNKATSLLKKHQDQLDLIAQALLKFETITGKHLEQILKSGKIEEAKQEPIHNEVDSLPI